MNIVDDIVKKASWIGKSAEQQPAGEDTSWLEKIVEHKTPSGESRRVKVKSLPPEEREKYNPHKKSPEQMDEKKKSPQQIEEKKDELKKKLEEIKTDKKPAQEETKTLDQKKEELTKKVKSNPRKEQLEKATGNDYSKADLKTLQSNMDNNLSKYDDKSVSVKSVTETEQLSSKNWDKYKSRIVENANDTIKKYAKAMAPDSRKILSGEIDRISGHIERGLKDGSLKASADKIDALLQENMKGMIHQDIETKRRALGDHGIRHVIANSKNTSILMDELEKGGIKTTGADRLAASLAMINHDMGYTIGEVAYNPRAQHKGQSADVFKENRAKYDDVFGKDLTDKMHHWIGTHDDIDFNWEDEPVASSIRFADTMSLFGEDKLPELFLRSGKATRVLTKMKLVFMSQGPDADVKSYKDELRKVVDSMEGDEVEKEELKNSIDEINDFGVNDFLSRYSGRLKGFRFDKKTKVMEADVAQSPEHELIQSMFEVGQKKFNSLNGDLGPKGVEVKDIGRESKQYISKGGKGTVQVNLVERDKDPINLTTNKELKDFYKISIRSQINQVKNAVLIPPPMNDEATIKKHIESISKTLSEPHKKLLQRISDVYISEVKSMGLDKKKPPFSDHEKARLDRLANLFKRFPLTDEERKWMNEKVASIKTAQSSKLRLKIDQAKRLVKQLQKKIEDTKVTWLKEKKMTGFGSDSIPYYMIAELDTKAGWMPANKMTLVVNEYGDILLKLGDRDTEAGELRWVGYWKSDDYSNHAIVSILNTK